MSAHSIVLGMISRAWFESLTPSPAALPARAWLPSDAPRLPLDGDWRFRFAPRADGSEAFAAPDFDDSGWGSLAVPGHWQLAGHGAPAYTNVDYPFPLDPPRVPDENPTGDYRRAFAAPADWPAGRTLLRFEGADSAARVWLNGTEVGTTTGSRLPTEFDVTPLLRADNVLAVRVVQWSAGSYLEDQDMWWLSGLFRGVSLVSRPAEGALDDIWVRAEYDHRTGTGTLLVEAPAGAVVRVPDLTLTSASAPALAGGVLPAALAGGLLPAALVLAESLPPATPVLAESLPPATPALAEGLPPATPALAEGLLPAGQIVNVGHVEPWSAESPRLYDVVVSTGAETVTVRAGFRTVAIEDGVLTVNGRRVLFRGVNRHEFHPDRGRAVTEDDMLADVLLMKRHNVNAVRTSHYPPHPRFLELCDEYGLWVVDECDLETHGFWHHDWRGNPADDPRFEALCVDRMRRTVERDKNHPSVVLWSLGNESGNEHGTARNLTAMAAWTKARDSTRPVLYERDWTCRDVDVYCRMYLTHDEVDAIGRHAEEPLPDPALDARRRAMPFIHLEYAHAMGNGPGGLAEYQELYERHPRCQGGFVWEWIDHGLRAHTPDGREYFAYGGDFGEVLHDGNFVADGLLFPDRRPSPGLLDLKKAVEPVRIGRSAAGLTIANRYHGLDLAHLEFRWTLEDDGAEVAGGALTVPDVAAGAAADVGLPDLPATAGEAHLTVSAVLAKDTAWADAGHEVAWAQFPLGSPPPAAVRFPPGTPSAAPRPGLAHASAAHAATATVAGGRVTLGPAEFDGRDGRLLRLGRLAVDGPEPQVWRALTDNDRGAHGEAVEPRWRAAGLHRLTRRVDAVTAGPASLVVRTRVAAAATDVGLLVTYTWSTPGGDGLRLVVDVTPDGPWDVPLPMLGVTLGLPGTLTDVAWFGRGPGEAYPDTGLATRVGRHRGSVASLQTPYVFPQENGRRAGVRWATLTDGSGAGLRVTGAVPFGLTVRPWTTAALDAATHPTDLTPDGRTWLTLDAGHNGIGSASCGPGPLPRYLLPAVATRLDLTFSLE